MILLFCYSFSSVVGGELGSGAGVADGVGVGVALGDGISFFNVKLAALL